MLSIAVFWPGLIAFLILLSLSLAGLIYYSAKQPRSLLFWIGGVIVCILLAYVINIFIVTPLFLN